MWIQPFKNKDLIIKHLDLDAFGVHEDRFGGSQTSDGYPES